MKIHLIGLALVSCLVAFNSCEEDATIVSTRLGDISGKRISVLDKTIDQYLGIPFSKPITRETRYKKAEPIDKYDNMINASTMPPDCPQISHNLLREKFGIVGNQKDDNCLFLNIWTPGEVAENGTLKPVMFWMYGGGFQVGAISLEIYNGKIISAFGDVVVVSTNYRLASFGFLTSGTEEEPGNLGFYDQNLALRWVHDNIASFGGDPSQVTIFGESAGSVSSSVHILSGQSDGLFRRAILQSGSYLTPVINTTENLVAAALKFAHQVDCASENEDFTPNRERIMNCLRNKSMDELIQGEKRLGIYPFVPRLDEAFLHTSDIRSFPAHFNKDIEVMIGLTEEEGNLMLAFGLLFGKDFNDPEKMMNKTETMHFATHCIGLYFTNASRLTEVYFENVEENDLIGSRTAFSNIVSDFYFNCPSIIFSDSYAAKGGLVHFYFMTHYSSQPSPLPDWLKSTHFSDIPFVFGEPLKPNSNFSSTDIEFAKYILTTWTNFAKGREFEEWPAFTPSSDIALELSPHRNSTVHIPRTQLCYDLWKPAFDERLSLHAN